MADPGRSPAGLADRVDVPALALRDVTVRYGSAVAVASASLEAYSGEFIAVTGHSGAGKSSLLWAVAGAVVASGSGEGADSSGAAGAETAAGAAPPPAQAATKSSRLTLSALARASADLLTRDSGTSRAAAAAEKSVTVFLSPALPAPWLDRM